MRVVEINVVFNISTNVEHVVLTKQTEFVHLQQWSTPPPPSSSTSLLLFLLLSPAFFSEYLFPNPDGEIISQIKMTNIALAEIKELLKQQVKQPHGQDTSYQPDLLYII